MSKKHPVREMLDNMPQPTPERLAELDAWGDLKEWGIEVEMRKQGWVPLDERGTAPDAPPKSGT